MYGWIIDKDLVADADAEPGTYSNAVTVAGPRDCPDALIDMLKGSTRNGYIGKFNDQRVRVFTFRMYDDDQIKYYEGRLIITEDEYIQCYRCGGTGKRDVGGTSVDCIVCDGGKSVSEVACVAPLTDFGRPNAGAVTIYYNNHAEMDCEA